jgi:ribonuclease BN (tRNA processing enzyme)
MMMSAITLLGTGTCQIEHERRASSVLLTLGETYILFDCGHGVVQRLLEAGVQHAQIEHVILSHFHPDHVSDLVPFLQAGAWSRRNPRTTDLHIYGPFGVQALIGGLMDLFGPGALTQPSYTVHIHEITELTFTVASQVFESISLPPAGNRGVRFRYRDKLYALTGDSFFHEEEKAFLQGVDFAVIDSGHISDAEIVELAVTSQARTLVCSHLYRELDAFALQEAATQRGYIGTLLVGRDLMTFVL